MRIVKVEGESRHFDRRGVILATMLFLAVWNVCPNAASNFQEGRRDPAIRVQAREDAIELMLSDAQESIEALLC